MSRQNRVDPWGDLHADSARGLLTGNRGCLIDDNGKLVRHHQGSLWIICLTDYRDWEHPLSRPKTWTPLFFLDDAVALASGHRPCGLCRRSDYLAYRTAVTVARTARSSVSAAELNRMLASERHRRGRGLDRAGDRLLTKYPLDDVPTGAVVANPATRRSHLVTEHDLRPFKFDGWGPPIERPRGITVEVLTPTTSVAALANGFVPRLHQSAKEPPGSTPDL